MIMRNILFVFVIAALVYACGSDGEPKKVKVSSDEIVVDTFTNGSPQIVRQFKMVDGAQVVFYEKEFYEDGKLLKEGPILMNSRDGKWKAYYRNGELWSEGYYSKGVRNDTIIGYYENGKMRYKGLFKNGVKHGVWMFYDENGAFKENKVYLLPGEKMVDSIRLGS